MKPYYERDGIVIFHGDSVELLEGMPAGTVDAVVTDPPFKLSQEYGSSTDPDNLSGVASIWPVSRELMRVTRSGAFAAVFYDNRILPFAISVFPKAGWKYLRSLTLYRRWGQASNVYGWMSTSDPVLLFVKPGAKYEFYGECKHDVFVKEAPESVNMGHPAQKPIGFVAQIAANVTPAGGTVLDPYMGSGTTLRAAKELGLRAIGIEKEEQYCEAVARELDTPKLFRAG